MIKMAITHVLHFADIHIRAGDIVQSRKAEYLHVFSNLERELDALEYVRQGTAVAVVCGDVFHHKYRLEGPAIQLWIKFIRVLTDRVPVIILSGNHDFRQERPDDPDLLEVMMQTLPPLRHECRYLRETGVIDFAGVQFGMVAIRETLNSCDTSGLVTDLPEFPSPLDGSSKKVALFHGTITQSRLPNGQLMSAGKGYPLEWFRDYDIVMLGDNHLQQTHSQKNGLPAWGYPGSLVQQDFGEPVTGHGFLVWDLDTCEARAFHVANDYSRLRVKLLHDGVYVKMHPMLDYVKIDDVEQDKLPRKPIVSINGNTGDDVVVSRLMKERGITPHSVSTVLNLQSGGNTKDVDETMRIMDDLTAIHSPAKWIEFIRSKDAHLAQQLSELQWIDNPEKILADLGEPPAEVAGKVKERTERICAAIASFRGIQEKSAKPNNVNLLYLEWAWTFAFGDNNWFNFETLDREIVLLNGKNASGKSSFMDVLCIALFGEPGKNRNVNATKRMSSLIIHHQKPPRVPMYCTVMFEVDSEKYVIERVYTPHKTKTDEFGIQMSKCELSRVEDDKCTLVCSGATLVDGWVRDHCGTIDNMLESTVVSQMDIHNFFMLKPAEQKERIDQSLNLESLQMYGNVLQQAIMAFNMWIETLGCYIQSGRSISEECDDVDKLERDLSEIIDNISALEKQSNILYAACGGESGNRDEDDGAEIPTDLAERRGRLQRELQGVNIENIIDSTIDEAFYNCKNVDTRPLADIIAEYEDTRAWMDKRCEADLESSITNTENALNCALQEWAEWKAVPFPTENNADAQCDTQNSDYDYRKALDALHKAEERLDTIKAKMTADAKPTREECGYDEWCAKLEEWTRILVEAQENNWPSVEKCKKNFEKCQTYVAKWTRLEQEREFVAGNMSELRKTFKQQTRDLKELADKCAKSGFSCLEDAKIYQSAKLIENECIAWKKLIDEKEKNGWKDVAECEKELEMAISDKQRKSYLDVWIPATKQELKVLQNLPFNPECTACCKNPSHIRRISLETEMSRVENELDRENGYADVDERIAYWRRGHQVCIEVGDEAKNARMRECDKILTSSNKVSLKNIEKIIMDFVAHASVKTEYDLKIRPRYEQKNTELSARAAEIERKLEEMGTHDGIVESLTAWQRAYEMRMLIDNRREFMENEVCEWEQSRPKWEAWRHLEADLVALQDSRDVAYEVAQNAWRREGLVLSRKQNRLREELGNRKNELSMYVEKRYLLEYLETAKVVKSIVLKREMAEVSRLQATAAARFERVTQDLKESRDIMRGLEKRLDSARRAQQWNREMGDKERIWNQWREKRDLLQSAFNILIGGKDDTDTFKEWIYESFIIPLLEKHVNSFLHTVSAAGAAPLRIEIEYRAKALVFTVHDRGNKTTFGLSSGFQQFIIGLAVRLALTRLGGRGHRFQTLLIDEGFVACDVDNVQNARDVLQHMMEVGGFRNILLATHLDTIKDMIPQKIGITRDGAFSRLQVGRRVHLLRNGDDISAPKRGRRKKITDAI